MTSSWHNAGNSADCCFVFSYSAQFPTQVCNVTCSDICSVGDCGIVVVIWTVLDKTLLEISASTAAACKVN